MNLDTDAIMRGISVISEHYDTIVEAKQPASFFEKKLIKLILVYLVFTTVVLRTAWESLRTYLSVVYIFWCFGIIELM